MAYTEILSSNGLTVTQWEDSIFSQYLGQVWWKNLMGESTNAIIQIKEDLTKQPGDTIKIGLRGEVEGGKVTGNSKGLGNEGKITFYNDSLTIDNVRYLVKVEDIPMSTQRVSFNLLKEVKEGLEEKAQIGTEEDITTALTDTSIGRVRGRYLYGAADSNYNATHATGLGNIDNTSDQLTTNMIDIAKRKAQIPVNATAKIRPMKIVVGKNTEEWYVFCAHTYCIRDMITNDAAWKNAQLNLPPQSNRDSVLFTGTWFKGSWNGTMIYEYERLPLISSTIQVAHCLFLGAQAGAIAWGQRSKFAEEFTDVGHDVTYESHEIRKIKKLVFNRATTEDNGVVNVFAAAVAD